MANTFRLCDRIAVHAFQTCHEQRKRKSQLKNIGKKIDLIEISF